MPRPLDHRALPILAVSAAHSSSLTVPARASAHPSVHAFATAFATPFAPAAAFARAAAFVYLSVAAFQSFSANVQPVAVEPAVVLAVVALALPVAVVPAVVLAVVAQLIFRDETHPNAAGFSGNMMLQTGNLFVVAPASQLLALRLVAPVYPLLVGVQPNSYTCLFRLDADTGSS